MSISDDYSASTAHCLLQIADIPCNIDKQKFYVSLANKLSIEQAQNKLVSVLCLHGAIDSNAVGIHWDFEWSSTLDQVHMNTIDNRRESRVVFLHYPPPDST